MTAGSLCQNALGEWIQDSCATPPVWAWGLQDPPARSTVDRSAAATTLEITGTNCGDSFEIVSAPLEMWTEVPEQLLPIWPATSSASSRVPVSLGVPWRVRAIGPHGSSWWSDTTDRPSVDLVCQPGAVETSIGQQFTRVSVRAERDQPILAFWGPQDGLLQASIPERNLVWVFDGPETVAIANQGAPADISAPRAVSGRTISGSVTDGSRSPVDGALVSLESLTEGSLAVAVESMTTTDEEGRFEFLGVATTGVVVRVQDDNRVPSVEKIAPGNDHVALDFKLLSGRPLRVLVSDTSGQPIEGAEIRSDIGHLVYTEARGVAHLGLVPIDQRVDLSVSAEGFQEIRHSTDSSDSEIVQVTLAEPSTVTGLVLDQESRLPASDATITIINGHQFSRWSSNRDGSFEIPIPSNQEVSLVIKSSSTGPTNHSIPRLSEGDQYDLGPVYLPTGLGATGRLLNREGSPVSGAKVWALRKSELPPLFAWHQGNLVETNSGPDGRFELWGLSAEEAPLRIEATGYAPQLTLATPSETTRFDDLGDLTLDHGAELIIQTAHENGRVVVDPFGFGFEFDLRKSEVENASATLLSIPLAKIQVQAFNNRGQLTCETTVQVDERKSEFDCRDAGVLVEGTVSLNNQPGQDGEIVFSRVAKGPSLILTSQSTFGAKSQKVVGGTVTAPTAPVDSGEFLGVVPSPGRWLATWVSKQRSWGPIEVEIPDAATHFASLHFGGLVVEGKVVDSQGVPAKALVELDGKAQATDDNGVFHFEGVRAGLQKLKARDWSDPRQSRQISLTLTEHSYPKYQLVELTDAGPKIEVVAVAPGSTVFLETNGGSYYTTTANTQGVAKFDISENDGQVRATSWHRGIWAIGSWMNLEQASEQGLLVHRKPVGTIIVRGDEPDPVSIQLGDWAYADFASRLGLPTTLHRGTLQARGLPEGTWKILEQARLIDQVTLTSGDILEVDLN